MRQLCKQRNLRTQHTAVDYFTSVKIVYNVECLFHRSYSVSLSQFAHVTDSVKEFSTSPQLDHHVELVLLIRSALSVSWVLDHTHPGLEPIQEFCNVRMMQRT